jgi:hypothetical protein
MSGNTIKVEFGEKKNRNELKKSKFFKGICVVHAHYEGIDDMLHIHENDVDNSLCVGVDSNRTNTERENIDIDTDGKRENIDTDGKRENIDTDGKSEKKLMRGFAHDFNNLFPDKFRIVRGVGYIRTIDNAQYVITCDHTMIKYATYKGYYLSGETDLKIIEFGMTVYQRLPEIDLVIMEITTKLDNPLPELDECDESCQIYYSSRNNYVVTCEYVPNKKYNMYENIMNYIPIHNDLTVKFEILKSDLIQQIPLINVPIIKIECVEKFITERRIDIAKDFAIVNKRRDTITKAIYAMFSGISGSIVRSGEVNIAMVCMCVDAESGMSLKAHSLIVIDALVKNIVRNRIYCLVGIQIDTLPCEITYNDEKQHYGHYVTKSSSSHMNGKKEFSFREGDMLLEVDGKKFNQDGLLWSDLLGMFVPLNAYTFIRSNSSQDTDTLQSISFKLAKQKNDGTKQKSIIRVYNLISSPYDEMYKLRICDNNYVLWKDYIFAELSEQLISYYKRLNIDINMTNIVPNIDQYVSNRCDKIVFLLNYKKTIRNNFDTEYYTSLPIKGRIGYYFYVLTYVSQKKITCLNDLMTTLNSEIVQKQRNVTLKFVGDNGAINILKVKN